MLFCPGFGEIGEREQACRDEQANADNHEAAEIGLNLVFEEESYDADGNHGYDDVERVVLFLVERAYTVLAGHDGVSSLEESFEYPCHLFPEDEKRAAHRSHVYGDGEREYLVGVVHTEQAAGKCQVSATADWQELCESLENAHDEGLKPIHS